MALMAPINPPGFLNSEVFGLEGSTKFGMFFTEPDFDPGAVGSVGTNGCNTAYAVNKDGMWVGGSDRFSVKGVSIGLKGEVLLGGRFGCLFVFHGQ